MASAITSVATGTARGPPSTHKAAVLQGGNSNAGRRKEARRGEGGARYAASRRRTADRGPRTADRRPADAWCLEPDACLVPGEGIEPHAPFGTSDFKSAASADFATRAVPEIRGHTLR